MPTTIAWLPKLNKISQDIAEEERKQAEIKTEVPEWAYDPERWFAPIDWRTPQPSLRTQRVEDWEKLIGIAAPKPDLLKNISDLFAPISWWSKFAARTLTKPLRPEVSKLTQRPPTKEEKAKGIFMYQPTGVEERAYEEWEAPGFEIPLSEKRPRFPWTPKTEEEFMRKWRVDIKGLAEEGSILPFWLIGIGGTKPLFKAAEKALIKLEAGKALTAAEKRILEKVALLESKAIQTGKSLLTEEAGFAKIRKPKGEIPAVPKPPVAPKVTELTGDIWNRMTPAEREQLGIKAKLDATARGERWIGLWGEQKRALVREFKKEQLAIPKAEVPITEVKPPEGEFLSPIERNVRLGMPEEQVWRPKAGVTPSIESAAQEAVGTAQKVARSSKKPPRPPIAQARGGKGVPPDDGNGTFTSVIDNPDFTLAGQLPGEPASRVLVRQHEGAMNKAGAELRLWVDEQKKLLRNIPERKAFGATKTSEAEQFIIDLAERATGGRERLAIRSPQLLAYFDRLAEKLAQIEARDIAHSAEMGRTLSLIPDYFPDLWRDTSPFTRRIGRLLGKGRPGVKEFFEKPRVFRTTGEAVEAGKEFITYDPAMLIALRDIAGIRRIQGDILFQKAQSAGLVIRDIRGKVPDGWRQPRSIPAFNPKPIPHTAGEEAPLMTSGYAVPNEFALRLEDYFGIVGRSANPAINAWAWLAGQGKKIKVLASLFQHLDFLRRGTASKIFVGEKPLEVPGMILETLEATLVPSKRLGLLKEWTTDPFLKMVAEEGAGIVGGQSIARRNLAGFFEDIKRFPLLGAIPERIPVVGKAIKLLNQATEYVNSGLFDGVYMAQAKHLARDWGNMLRKLHPTWTERQIAAATADNISIALSSQATWQSVFRNQGTRQFMRGLLFSSAESEGLIRGFLRALPGVGQSEARALWRRYWIGYYLTALATAEAINYSVNGEFLGQEQLTPLILDQTGRPKYNWKFIRPIFGVTEQGVPMYLDLLGQLDTPLRWAIDPPTALKNRLSVPTRQLLDQIRNQQFTGRSITTAKDFLTRLKERFMYGLKEVGTPITPGQILREPLPAWAQALQATGFGVVAPTEKEPSPFEFTRPTGATPEKPEEYEFTRPR